MAYGDSSLKGRVVRVGTGVQERFTAVFTTAGASNPTIDTAKTRGPVSIARTGTGVTTITLPRALRNAVVTVSRAAGTTAQLAGGDMAEGGLTCLVTTVTAGGSTAADSTGITLHVTIEGTSR